MRLKKGHLKAHAFDKFRFYSLILKYGLTLFNS
jgi:hypothetical protein